MRQTSFNFIKDYKKQFGGTLLLGKRKMKRPLSTKNPIHLILKSNRKDIFKPGNRSLENLIRSQCERFSIHIYDFALNWSHVHLLIRIRDRQDYIKFIRALTSLIATRVRQFQNEIRNGNLGREPCQSDSDLQKIFTLRPFTRIINWGRDFKNALSYQILNQFEALGMISRKKKKTKFKLTSHKKRLIGCLSS